MLIQKELGEKCAYWVSALQEYDLEIRLGKIVHGQGLCKLASQPINSPNNEEAEWENQETSEEGQIYFLPATTDS